jgi:acetyltransferase
MDLNEYMDKLFYPKSVAIIEASSRRPWYINGITERDYEGDLYLVSSKEDEIMGMKCYKDISELPDKIDMSIIAINRNKLKDVIKQCIEKKFYTLHIFSAGLGEYDPKGFAIEKDIRQIIKNSETRAIGPNCMGIYSTGGRISYSPYFSKEFCSKKCVSFASHSGDLTTRYVIIENDHGVKFSNVASIGNSIDLEISDFISYFSSHKKTDIIGVYFEGFSQYGEFEGRRLIDVVKNNKKPLLILRGGVSEEGKRSVSSHTGTIASDNNIWDSIFSQGNALKMETYEDLLDSTIAFNYCEHYPEVNSLILITWSGGKAVLGVDRIINLGIKIPQIKAEAQEKMKEMISIGSVSNPLDLPWIGRRPKYPEICKIAINEPYIGGTIFETIAPTSFDDRHEIYYNNIIKIYQYSKEAKKPFLMSLPFDNVIQREELKNNFIADNIPVFPSIERAAKAFLNLYKFNKRFNSNE